MSELIRRCINTLSIGLDFSNGTFLPVHEEAIKGTLFELFRTDEAFSIETFASLATEKGWSAKHVFFARDIAPLVQSPGYTFASGVAGFGAELVRNERMGLILEELDSEMKRQAERDAERNILIDSVLARYGNLTGPNTHSDEKVDSLTWIAIIGAFAILFALILFAPDRSTADGVQHTFDRSDW